MSSFTDLADELDGLAASLRDCEDSLNAIRELEARLKVVGHRLTSTHERVAAILARVEDLP